MRIVGMFALFLKNLSKSCVPLSTLLERPFSDLIPDFEPVRPSLSLRTRDLGLRACGSGRVLLLFWILGGGGRLFLGMSTFPEPEAGRRGLAEPGFLGLS